VSEADPDAGLQQWLVFDRWLYLGSADSLDAAHRLAESARPDAAVRFDTMAYRLIRRVLEAESTDAPQGLSRTALAHV
jgi:hypothetical protein